MEEREEIEREASRPLRAVDGEAHAPEHGYDDAEDFQVDAFVEDTDRLEFRPYPGMPPCVMEVRHAITRATFAQHRRDLRAFRQDMLRLEHVEDRLAKLDDQDSSEADELKSEIEELRALPDEIDMESEALVLPTVIWWNLKLNGKPVPLTLEGLRSLPTKLHAGVVKTIVDWATGQTQGKKRKKPKTRRTSSRGSQTRR